MNIFGILVQLVAGPLIILLMPRTKVPHLIILSFRGPFWALQRPGSHG